MKNVLLLAGAGQIGMAIVRRVGTGMKIVIGDKWLEHAQNIETILDGAGFDAEAMEMDLSSRDSIQHFIAEGQKYGPITMLVNAAGGAGHLHRQCPGHRLASVYVWHHPPGGFLL